jgi:hypothetical protein
MGMVHSAEEKDQAASLEVLDINLGKDFRQFV